jgi:hypothetical protein
MTTETRRARRNTEKSNAEKSNTEYGPQMNTEGTEIKTAESTGNATNPYAAPQTVTCQQKVFVSPYYLQFSFWLSAAFGWLAAAILLSLFVSIAGLSELGGDQSIVIGVILHIIAALIGFFDARWRWSKTNKSAT